MRTWGRDREVEKVKPKPAANAHESMLEAWQIFRARLLPQAQPEHLEEMRRAFYAGAAGCFGLVLRVTAPDLGDEVTFAKMNALEAELRQFPNDLRILPPRPPR